MKLLFILALLIFIKCVLTYRVYELLPLKELKRRARSKDRKAAAIYKVATYQGGIQIVTWFLGTISAITLILITASAGWLLSVIILVFIAWLLIWAPPPKVNGMIWNIAVFSAPYYAALLSFIQPVTGRISDMIPRFGKVHLHTGLYEKEDLEQLLKNQNNQLDNRIPESDLRIAFGGLTFGDKTVGSVMTPRRKIKLVAVADPIGPLLMDEVHASGFSRFPVVKEATKSANPEIVGTLYLKDLLNHSEGGKVRDVMRKDVYFINETNNLREALAAFIKTQHHLLVVVNNFEELVGVITLEDVMEQIVGKKLTDEFERYDDLRTVAAMEARADKSAHNEVPEPKDEQDEKESAQQKVEEPAN
jgi:CBS domain containing-hemolysin-like protein